MTFNSLLFFAFFIATLGVYWALPWRAQNVLLLVASYVFYGWVHPWWAALLLATTSVDYAAPLLIARRPAHRRLWLTMSLAANLGVLGFYKYFGFFVENLSAAGAALGWTLPVPVWQILLPAGISFYTFQSMSYTIDVYRGHAAARTRFVDVAAFVSFFPHLVAGPIMRATNLLPQFERPRRFSAAASRDATLLIIWGLFKKLVIADNVGLIANKVFALEAPGFFVLWAGVLAFAVQIYADFSGYTDIARGVAQWYGFSLIPNFARPYLATGPADFWRRWNISLSSWFRDYVYIPLGGSRRGPWRQAVNVMVTFVASGLWHGASWNFVLWGAYHGVLLVGGRIIGGRWSETRAIRPLRVAAMFALTCVGWLIFREAEWSHLVRNLTLRPGDAFDWSAGVYLGGLALLYSVPLWIQNVWVEMGGANLTLALDVQEDAVDGTRVLSPQALLAGLLTAGIVTLRAESSLSFIYFAF